VKEVRPPVAKAQQRIELPTNQQLTPDQNDGRVNWTVRDGQLLIQTERLAWPPIHDDSSGPESFDDWDLGQRPRRVELGETEGLIVLDDFVESSRSTDDFPLQQPLLPSQNQHWSLMNYVLILSRQLSNWGKSPSQFEKCMICSTSSVVNGNCSLESIHDRFS
jgi:hypothetical protein